MKQVIRSHTTRAFTIIELLVVVSIIALLVGILLPAIGKARDQVLLTRSNNNLSQLGKASAIYTAEYAERQITFINDTFASYGTSGTVAVQAFYSKNGIAHPGVVLGFGRSDTGIPGTWGYWMPVTPGVPPNAANWVIAAPIDYAQKFGGFRYPNVRTFSTYINGRFHDPTFYAPKDTAVMASVEPIFDHADEYFNAANPPNNGPRLSSYCFSPAAGFSPDVLGYNKSTAKFYTNPFQLQGSFRSPSISQATYSNLKTHMIEHNWLQNRKKECNPNFAPGTYDGCEPYYFNASYLSSPVCLFYDGHIGAGGVRDAVEANSRVDTQTPLANHGLWSIHTPMAGSYAQGSDGGYFHDFAFDNASTSFHIATIDGIRGRDFVGK